MSIGTSTNSEMNWRFSQETSILPGQQSGSAGDRPKILHRTSGDLVAQLIASRPSASLSNHSQVAAVELRGIICCAKIAHAVTGLA